MTKSSYIGRTIGLYATLGAILAAASVGTVVVGGQSAQQRIAPGEIKWPPAASAVAGTSGAAQTVVLKGDPAKAGLYTLVLRVGPNTTIQPHAHPDDRVATVVSGTWYFGYGREFDDKALKELPAGSFYTEPPGVDHFAMTRDEAAVLQITGTGPSGTTYADPRNDPAKRP